MLCKGFTKAKKSCSRKASDNFGYCWQHTDENQIKHISKIPEITTISEYKEVNRRFQENTLIGKTLSSDVLSTLLQYVTIPAETSKIFNLTTSQKYNIVILKLKQTLKIELGKLCNRDIEILYSLIQYKGLDPKYLAQTVNKGLLNQEIYIGYVNDVVLNQVAIFLLGLYKNKHFDLFDKYIGIMIQRLNICKTEYKIIDENFLINYSERNKFRIDVMTDDILLVLNLFNLDNEIKMLLNNNHDIYINLSDFIVNDLEPISIEIYIQTHKIGNKIRKYLSEQSVYFSDISDTWIYTIYKNKLTDVILESGIQRLYTYNTISIYFSNAKFIKLNIIEAIQKEDIKFFEWFLENFKR